MKVLKYALIATLLLPAGGALAQDVNASEMMTGLTMVQSNVDRAFQRLNIDADPRDLSLAQLAEIIGVLNDPAMSSGGESTKRTIETIIEANRFN